MTALSPDAKHDLLVQKWGLEETKKRISELRAKGQAQSALRAVDILYQEVQWESVAEDLKLQGFYLGTYKRGPPGLEQDETYILTKEGPKRVWIDNLEMLMPLDSLDAHGILAPIEFSGASKIRNIGNGEERLRVTDGASFKRTNLPAQLLSQWSNGLEDISGEGKPIFVVQAISQVREVVPPEGWIQSDAGKRQRVQDIPAYPVVDGEGAINLQLILGVDGGARTSAKIHAEEDLTNLLDDQQVDDRKAFFDWIAANAMMNHSKVMDELKSLAGVQAVVFGSGGDEMSIKDKETGKREKTQLSGSFIATNQLGFILSLGNAEKRIKAAAEGDVVVQARPSAAAPKPKLAEHKDEVPKKGFEEAFLDLVDAGTATREEAKKLAMSYKAMDTNELMDIMKKLDGSIIKYDFTAKKYARLKPKE